MTRIDRLREQARTLQCQIKASIRNGSIIAADRLNSHLKKIEAQIAQAEEYEPKLLREVIDNDTLVRSGLAKKIVEVHLAADYLADCSHELKDIFKKLELVDNTLYPKIEAIRKESQAFANTVCHPEFAGLENFMCNNDRLIDDMHLLAQRYIDEHLVITDR